jgi:hypothetical protein
VDVTGDWSQHTLLRGKLQQKPQHPERAFDQTRGTASCFVSRYKSEALLALGASTASIVGSGKTGWFRTSPNRLAYLLNAFSSIRERKLAFHVTHAPNNAD